MKRQQALELDPRKAASVGPRQLKDPNSVEYAWQTLSWLKTLWSSLALSEEQWERALKEADENKIWSRIPPRSPFGSLEAMLKKELGVGVEESVQHIKVGNRGGRIGNKNASKEEEKTNLVDASFVSPKYGTAAHWRARLERDAPTNKQASKALGRLNAGEVSANKAAIEMGWRPPPDPVKAVSRELRKIPISRSEETISGDLRGAKMVVRGLTREEQIELWDWLGRELDR